MEETSSTIFAIKTPRYNCRSVSLTKFILYNPQMSIVKHFSVGSIKPESGNKRKVKSQWIFMTSDV